MINSYCKLEVKRIGIGMAICISISSVMFTHLIISTLVP